MNSNQSSGNKPWVVILAMLGGLAVFGGLRSWLFRLLGIVFGFGVFVIIAVIALVIYFSCRKDENAPPTREAGAGTQRTYQQPYHGQTQGQQPPRPQQQTQTQQASRPQGIPPCQLSPEAMQILNKGRSHLMELRRLLGRIQNLNVHKRGQDICVEIERILQALQQQPEDIPMVRQFFNYYLPTLGNILLKYLRLEEAGMATDQTTVKVMACLGEIKTAMEKQHAAIYENDLLDLTVEMESLTQACKRDGLLVSEDFKIKEGDREICLTL